MFDLPFLSDVTLPWLAEVLAVLATLLAVQLGVYALLRQMERVTRRTSTIWDDALVRAIGRPLQVLIWVIGLTIAATVIQRHSTSALFDYVEPARKIGIILCLAWFLFRLVGHISDNIVHAREALLGEEVDRTTVDALGKLSRISILIVALLTILQTIGVSISGVVAFGGIGGIAVGFAAKDILANFFGGLTIYLDRPFVVGEWIRSPDRQIEGTVEYISWRHTRVRAFNKNPIYVPNAVFTTIVVENPSRMSNRRIKETIGIRYQDLGKMPAIIRDVKVMLQSHPEIDTDKTLIVNFNEFADSSLNFFIYTFTKTIEWVKYHEIKQDVLLKTAAIIEAHGAEIAFPTRTVHIESNEGIPPEALR